MTESGERAFAAFEVSGADVIEHQRAFGEVPFGESVLDAPLPLEQPVKGVIELRFVDLRIQAQQRRQRGGSGLRMKSTGSGQFGGRFENASDHHGDDQIALGTRGAGEDGFQAGAPQSAESRGDVAVGGGAPNLEGVGRGDEGLAFEDATEGVNLGSRPSGEIGEGALDDFASGAGGLAEEDGGRGIAIGDGLHIHGAMISHLKQLYNGKTTDYMGTINN
jgi:hypothetical protein